ncbi:MAG: restriction endonuclease subunit S [Desulfobacterales bacterium]|nr:restriction endonuclease subunit S [Desulfobacterales bacterium]
MKTKSKTVKADKASAQGRVPKQRFPEFWNAGAWEEKELKLVCQMQAGKFISASKIYEKREEDLYPCYGGNGLRGFTRTYTHMGKYSLIGRQGALCGNITLVEGMFHATEHAVVATPIGDTDTEWLYYELLNLNLNQYATGQAQPGLSVKSLERITVKVPIEEKEQQKIADCLSSIDKLITAQSQKLDTLNAHKKGLMQQLFPAEGETVPKLRFPEFRDAGEWEEKRLGQVVKFLDGQRKPIKESDRASMQGQYPYHGASGIIDYINDFIFDETLILLGEDGENIVSRNLPLVFKISGKCWVNNHAHVLKPNKPHHLDFLVQYLESLSYIKYNSGGAQPKLNQAVCKTIPLLLPKPPEQEKIAGCLSSIDELIAAHSQKLDTFKAHKKGLMQQLFPSADEVNR